MDLQLLWARDNQMHDITFGVTTSCRHRSDGGSIRGPTLKSSCFRRRADIGTRAGWYRADIGPMAEAAFWANIKVVVFRRRADVGTRAGWYRADIGPMAGDTWRADVVKCTCRLP